MNRLLLCTLTSYLLLISGCSKDEPADCGCGKGIEVVFTIEDSDEQTGYLFEVEETYQNPHLPKFKYAIRFAEDGCSNCEHNFLVCNNSFLADFEANLTYPGVEVKFSGLAKNLCEDPPVLADQTYNHIILTHIELQ